MVSQDAPILLNAKNILFVTHNYDSKSKGTHLEAMFSKFRRRDA